MDRFYRFVGKYLPDLIAIILTIIILTVGIYFAINVDPMWLNRTGSLIIIIGLILAVTRYDEWLKKKFKNYLVSDSDYISQRIITKIIDKKDKENQPLSDEERIKYEMHISANLKSYIGRQESNEFIENMFEPDRRRLKYLEIVLIIIGTFLSGFGDFFINSLINKF